MLSATAASRYSAGEAEQEALIKAQIEVSRLGEKLDDLESERAFATAMSPPLTDERSRA